jgi:hypothetical protein
MSDRCTCATMQTGCLVHPRGKSSHRIETCSDFLQPGWWGACSCGWEGDVRQFHPEAMSDAAIHAGSQS